MAKAYTANFKEKTGSTSGEEPVYLLEITHPQLAVPVRVVRDTLDLYRGEHLALPGIAGNYASTPDSAAVSVTGDLEASGEFSPTDAAAVNGLLYKSQSFDVRLRADGKLQAYFSLDGSAIITAVSSVTAAFVSATAKFWKVTRNATTGTVKFFTGADGLSYTQLGTDQATTAGALYNSIADLLVGRSGGSALKFGGKPDPNYVHATPAAVSGLTAASLEFWVRVDNFGASNTTPIGIGPGTGNGLWRIDIYTTGAIAADFWLEGNATSVGGVISLGTTYHVVSTFNGTTKKIYVNGVEVGTANSGATAVASADVFIGRGYPSYGLEGAMDGVRIYNRALSATEVAEHYAGTYNNETGLIGNWQLDDGSGLVAVDSSASAANGALIVSTAYPSWVVPLAINNNATGKIYSAEIRNGIDGPVVAKFNPSTDARPGDTSFVSSTTGETWTINQSGAPAAAIAADETYVAMNFRIQLPDDLQGKLPRAPIQIDNVGRALTDWIDASKGGKGATVRVMQVMRDDPDTLEYDATLDLLSVRQNGAHVTGELGYEDTLNLPALAAFHRPDNQPAIF